MVTDSLYRVSLKCIIRNNAGDILFIKETGRSLWDLPGGGIEHGETIRQGIARELREEIGLDSGFSYEVLGVSEPKKLQTRDVWQMQMFLEVTPEQRAFGPGDEADVVTFMPLEPLRASGEEFEQETYRFIITRL